MTDTIIWIAAICGAIATIGGALGTIYRLVKRVDDALGKDEEGKTATERLEEKVTHMADRLEKVESAVINEREGTTVNDRLNAHAADVTKRLSKVEYQLFPNSGGSLSDKVTEVHLQVATINGQLTVLTEMVQNLAAKRSSGRAR